MLREASEVRANYSQQHTQHGPVLRLLLTLRKDAPGAMLREAGTLLAELLTSADRLHKCISNMVRTKQREAANCTGGPKEKRPIKKEVEGYLKILREVLAIRKKFRESKHKFDVLGGVVAPSRGEGASLLGQHGSSSGDGGDGGGGGGGEAEDEEKRAMQEKTSADGEGGGEGGDVVAVKKKRGRPRKIKPEEEGEGEGDGEGGGEDGGGGAEHGGGEGGGGSGRWRRGSQRQSRRRWGGDDRQEEARSAK